MKADVKKEIIKDNIDRNLYNINRQIQLLNNQKEEYLLKQNNLNKINYFSKEEVKEIIEYLVSNIEGEQYCIEKLNINTKSSSYHVDNMVCQYKFLYLVKNDNDESAKAEIKDKYEIKEINDEYYIDGIDNMEKTDISDNYVKLSFYNRYSDHDVIFTNQEKNGIISINIEDERFNYINDFINEIIDKRLDTKNYKLSVSQMKLVADEYIKNHKNSKKLIKDIK